MASVRWRSLFRHTLVLVPAAAFRRCQYLHGSYSVTAVQVQAERDELPALIGENPYRRIIKRNCRRREAADITHLPDRLHGLVKRNRTEEIRKYLEEETQPMDGIPCGFRRSSERTIP
jgi:hypothetical protein